MEKLIISIPAGNALAQAKQAEPSRGQIPAECALFSVSLTEFLSFGILILQNRMLNFFGISAKLVTIHSF